MVFKFSPKIQRLYASVPVGRVCCAGAALIVAGGFTYFMVQTLSGDERFHREWVIPLVHRWLSPEPAHIVAVRVAKYGILANFAENRKEYPALACTLFGKPLNNPIGLAAGFDKNGLAIDGLRCSGFGFVEIGSVTPQLQMGNRRPRVFRLTADEAVINSYGFNNEGIEPVLARVKKAHDPQSSVPLGVNLGKNKGTVDALDDFAAGVTSFGPYCDYLVVNISSPNTPGLRALHEKAELKKLLVSLRETVQRTAASGSATAATEQQPQQRRVPHLFVKISPDLTRQQLADVAEVCMDRRSGGVPVDGFIVTNTTMQRWETLIGDDALRPGGLSGQPLRELSTKCIAEMYRLTRGQIPIIGCGGVASGADAYEKIKAGASAVQLYTAMVFQGFPVIGRVKRELAELLAADGYANVAEAVGAQHRKK